MANPAGQSHLSDEQNRILELEAAIRKHRDQRGDDKCWLDDQELYNVLGDGNLGDNSLPAKEKFLNNCANYYEKRCKNANWPSYQELEEKIKTLEAQLGQNKETTPRYHVHSRPECPFNYCDQSEPWLACLTKCRHAK